MGNLLAVFEWDFERELAVFFSTCGLLNRRTLFLRHLFCLGVERSSKCD